MQNTLDIRIEGESVDLAPSTQFDLELYNSMLDIEAPQSSRGIGITLPFTPENHKKLGYIYHPQSTTTKRNYQADIYIATNLVDSGYAYLRDANGSYPMDFTSNIKEFFGAYQARMLTDIDLGVVNIPPILSDTLVDTWYNSNGCVFPTVKNELYYEKNVPVGFDGLVNKYNTGSYVTSPKTPCFFLKHILQKVGDLAGVTYAGDFWNDSNTAKLILYNTREATPGTSIERRIFMPEMSIAQLILGLRKTFNLYLRFDVYRRILRLDYAKDVYAGLCEIDWSAQAPDFVGGSPSTVPGLELSWLLDSNDQMYKDPFFDPYATAGADGQRLKISSHFRTLKMASGLPTTLQFGIATNQLDKKCVPGLLSWQGVISGIPFANNFFGEVVMQWNGTGNLYDVYWKSEEVFRQNGYRVESRVGLSSAQVAKMSAILRGEDDGLPIVHMNGTNYLLERMIVPSQNTNLPLISAWRL